jgi:hypothetical protein
VHHGHLDSDDEGQNDRLFLRVIGDNGDLGDLLADAVANLDSQPEPDL